MRHQTTYTFTHLRAAVLFAHWLKENEGTADFGSPKLLYSPRQVGSGFYDWCVEYDADDLSFARGLATGYDLCSLAYERDSCEACGEGGESDDNEEGEGEACEKCGKPTFCKATICEDCDEGRTPLHTCNKCGTPCEYWHDLCERCATTSAAVNRPHD